MAEVTIAVTAQTLQQDAIHRATDLACVELEQAAQDVDTFWRRYRMWGRGFEFRITETFPDHLYPDGPEPI